MYFYFEGKAAIVFSGGILLESDEVKTNSVACNIPVVSHRSVEKAVQYAKRIQYDATSKIAVDVVLNSCLKNMTVYPLQCKAGTCKVELWGETGNTKVLDMIYKILVYYMWKQSLVYCSHC